jgi:CHAD domain-containing protein
VRRSLRRAVASRADVDFHEWRKRVKELRYQVELLAAGASVELKTREKALGKLAEELGKVTDALVLLRELERLEEDGAIPPGAAWLDRIRLLIREQSDTLLSGGTELFADAPRRFARRVLAERG